MNLTSAAWSTLGWLTAYPALVRELIAADAVVREDGAVSVGPGALRARGWKLQAQEAWPGFCAVCTEISVDHVTGAKTLNLEIGDPDSDAPSVRGGVLTLAGHGTINGRVIQAGDTIEIDTPDECRLDLAPKAMTREDHMRVHKLLFEAAPKLPTDFEPYGQRSREVPEWSPDCSCGCKHFYTLEGPLGADWGVCGNPASPRHGMLTFEHQGCPQYEDEAEAPIDPHASVTAPPFPFDRDEMTRRIREHQAALPDLSHLTVIVPAAHLAMVAGWFPQNDPKQPRVETWRGCDDSVFVLDRSKAGVSPSGVFSDAKSTPWVRVHTYAVRAHAARRGNRIGADRAGARVRRLPGQAHMSRYLVLGCRPWNIRAVEELARRMPEHEWAFEWRVTADRDADVTGIRPWDFLRDNGYAAVFVLHWNEIIPPEALAVCPFVGFHMGWQRGGSPLQYEIIDDGDTAGQVPLRAFRLTDTIDGGPVLNSQWLSLGGSAEEIYMRADRQAADMICQLVRFNPTMAPSDLGEDPRTQMRDDLPPRQRRTPAQSRVPADLDLLRLHDHIRMLDAEGYPRAFVEVDGYRIEFSRASLRHDGVLADARITRIER